MKARCNLREHRGKLTLADVSRATGVSQPVLSQLERGHLLPTDAAARALGNFLNVDLAQLWEFRGPLLVVDMDAEEEAA